MLFLVISRHLPAFAPIRPQLEIATIRAGLEKWANHPNVKAFYGLAGQPASYAIVEAETAEELHRTLLVNHAFGYSSMEIYPLVPPQESLDIMQEQSRMLAEAGPPS